MLFKKQNPTKPKQICNSVPKNTITKYKVKNKARFGWLV